jgi:hypothetical protein
MVLLGIVGIWYMLALLTIAARACPPGIEAAAYGLVLAAIDLGGTLGEKIGSSIFDHYGGVGRPVDSWHSLLTIGFLLSGLAALFIPFLPSWARSRQTLREQREVAVSGPGAAAAEEQSGRIG